MLNGVPRILIIRLSAIGDVVRVLPALHSLREAHPDAQIDWAVERKAAEVVQGHPEIDQLIVFDRAEHFWESTRAFMSFCRRVRAGHYDVVFDFHGILKSGIATARSGAPERYGFARPRSQEFSYLFTNNKVELHSPNLNRIEENLALVQGLAPHHRSTDVTLNVAPEIQEEVGKYFLETFDGGKQVVAVHPPMDRPEKRWPTEHFAEMVDMLLADGRFEVVLTWGPGQQAIAEEVALKACRNPVVAPEMPTVKHYAWLVQLAQLYVGGDTGPMHLASAMGTPIVAIFGGTDPAKHAPYRGDYKILRYEGEDPGANIHRISVEQVYDACVDLTCKAGDPEAANESVS